MKRALIGLFATFILSLPLDAAKITPFVSLDQFIERAKQIVIVTCVSNDIDDGWDLGGGRYASRVTVINTLKGKILTRDFQVRTDIQLVPGTRYLLTFYSEPKPPEIASAYDELCAVRMHSEFSPGFEQMSLKQKIQQIFGDRLIEVEDDQKKLAREKASLEKAKEK
jgi:hypothetical protein